MASVPLNPALRYLKMSERKYANQKPLRAVAERALFNQGYEVEVVRGSGGARLAATKGGKSSNVAVRTSSDRWVGWMRDENAEWRGMRGADLIVVAALGPNGADIYAFDSKPVEKAFDENLAAREANNADLSKTAPIFVCLDAVAPGRGPSATSSNLKAKALWSETLPLALATEATAGEVSLPDAEEGFVDRVRREFAGRVGVAVEKVTVEFKVSA